MSVPIGTERFNTGKQGRCRVKTENGWKLRSIVKMEKKIGGPVPNGYLVHHIDEDQTNDDDGNLELKKWGEHSRDHHLGKKYQKKVRSTEHPNSQLNVGHIRMIRRMANRGLSQKKIGRTVQVSQVMVGKILRGESWAWL